MRFIIRGENVEVTPAIREYAEKKISKIDRYFEEFQDVRINIKVYNGQQKIEVTIPSTHLLLRAEESHSDLYAAIDVVVDKLERQIRKHKTKVHRKLREKGSIKDFFLNSTEPTSVSVLDEEEEVEIVRTKSFDLKPMDVEEAILQMNMLGHNFFVFNNAITNAINVVYIRKDGKYGLIETK